MLLSFASIIPYTINQLSWKFEDERIDNFFVLGNYTIRQGAGSDFRTRNKTFSIENNSRNDKGMNYFLKQPMFFSSENVLSIIREQGFYNIIHKSEHLKSKIGNHIPIFFDYNTNDAILILEWISNAKNFRDYLSLLPEKPILCTADIAKKIGGLLHNFHDSFRGFEQDFKTQKPLFFNANPLPVFTIDFDILDFQQQFKSDLRIIIKEINEDKDHNFKLIIEDCQRYWQQESHPTLINGDFKPANVLIRENAEKKDIDVFFIDWEYAIWGSPEFDLATFYFYQLRVKDFTIDNEDSVLFTALLEGYYGVEKPDAETLKKITAFCKIRIIDHWSQNRLNDAKDEEDKNNKIAVLQKTLELINSLEIN